MSKDKRGIPGDCQHGSHGLRAMQGTLKRIRDGGGDWLAELGDVGQVVRELKVDLIADLGGEERVSTAQRIIVEQTAKTWTMLQSVDAWLLRQKSLVNRRNRMLFPVVLQRQTLEDSLVRNLRALGLEKTAKPVSVNDWEPPSDAA